MLSVIPHFNRAIAESLHGDGAQIPFVTMLTDLADYPPHFWIERESEYLICGTERARQQALCMGHSSQHVFETSGMVLKPRFYEKPILDRSSERRSIGLDPALPTGVVVFGGHGSSAMLDIAELLNASNRNVPLIMLCGHNHKLAAELRNMHCSTPMIVEEFTPKVDYFMSLADFFIGKPGPGCISEALQFDLPLIVECNSRTLPQERYNTAWLREKRLGIVLDSFADIVSGVNQLLDDSMFHEFQKNARSYTNRALFEVPGILDEVLLRHAQHTVYAQPFNWSHADLSVASL